MTETSAAKNSPQAVPPPDDPRKRHEELNLDLTSGGENKRLAQLRLAALEQLHSMTPADEGQTIAPVPRQSNWVQMGPMAIPSGQTYSGSRVNVTGRVTAIVVDPTDSNIIYVGTAQGGIWKTTNRGKSWIPISDNEASLAIGSLTLDPTNHLILYAGTGEGNFSGDSYYGSGVLKSTDGGASWLLLGENLFAGGSFCRIVVHPKTPTILYAAMSYGLYRSMDGGTNWAQLGNNVLPTSFVTDVVIDPSMPDTVYAAFWGSGIYRTTNASAATPSWTNLTTGLPTGGYSRIALGISYSSPKTLYALMANSTQFYTIDQFYRTTDGGNTWTRIVFPDGDIGSQGFYNLHVAVDPTTPDIVFLSGISLWKATRNSTSGAWTFTDIGATYHPDNHAFAFDPKNHQILYAGSDGGIYTSNDGGNTWSDTINRGLCITQFEFMEQHPHSDALVFAGTQDNGTEQFRNSPVFYHADDGDGGFVAIDHNSPTNVLSTYYNLTPKRSTVGGVYGTWIDVSNGLSGNSLFYPPLALDQSNSNNIAIGADKIFLDTAQGTGGWQTTVTLPGLFVGSESVSEINYVNSNLIYVGTSSGKVYRLTRSGNTWTAVEISTPPLPQQFIWDIATLPGNVNTIIVVMSGFGSSHVWRGSVPASGIGAATWTDITGTGTGKLPDIPVNAVVVDPVQPNTIYIATDIAVFSTTNGGTTWGEFSSGLPNCAVFDMGLHEPTRLLRVATHGRGMWERKLDVQSQPDVNLFVRHNLMDTGRVPSSSISAISAFQDPLRYIELSDQLYWWQCADIKIDAQEGTPPAYQMDVAQVDYVSFESKLQLRGTQRGHLNRVYAHIHNRGILPAQQVTVKLLYTDASAGLPDLPADFWQVFPADSADTTTWKAVGPAKFFSSLLPTEPAVLEWDLNIPATAADHFCFLLITDSASDPIPPVNRVFNIATLISNEKRVGMHNLHVVTAAPNSFYWTPFHFYGDPAQSHTITIPASIASGWGIGLFFQTGTQKALKLDRVTSTKPTDAMLKALSSRIGSDSGKYDTSALYMLNNPTTGASLSNVTIPKGGLSAMLLLVPPSTAGATGKVSILQGTNQGPVGGSTFILRSAT